MLVCGVQTVMWGGYAGVWCANSDVGRVCWYVVCRL